MYPFLFALVACAGTTEVQRTAYLMGTTLRVELRAADRACGLAATEAVLTEVARLEGLLSTYSATSELGVLNATEPGVAAAVGAELAALLAEARTWSERTDRAFDPGIGALIDAWDLRGAGRVPTADGLAHARANSGIGMLPVTGWRRPHEAWWLDTGAFGKGVALRAAAAVLRRHGVTDALLDFGGQLLVVGAGRVVAVAHPAERDSALPLRLRLADVSIATTSSSERNVTVAGTRYGHVLDPRSGRPAPAWGSVSVVAADAVAADVLSTALFVLGPDAALAWADGHPEYGVLVQEVRGDVVVSRASVGLAAFVVSQPSKL